MRASKESRQSKRESRLSDAQLSKQSKRFEKHLRSLFLKFVCFGSGEARNVFPSTSIGGILTSGPPDLCAVFMEIVKRVTMHKPHFWLRNRFSERM